MQNLQQRRLFTIFNRVHITIQIIAQLQSIYVGNRELLTLISTKPCRLHNYSVYIKIHAALLESHLCYKLHVRFCSELHLTLLTLFSEEPCTLAHQLVKGDLGRCGRRLVEAKTSII